MALFLAGGAYYVWNTHQKLTDATERLAKLEQNPSINEFNALVETVGALQREFAAYQSTTAANPDQTQRTQILQLQQDFAALQETMKKQQEEMRMAFLTAGGAYVWNTHQKLTDVTERVAKLEQNPSRNEFKALVEIVRALQREFAAYQSTMAANPDQTQRTQILQLQQDFAALQATMNQIQEQMQPMAGLTRQMEMQALQQHTISTQMAQLRSESATVQKTMAEFLTQIQKQVRLQQQEMNVLMTYLQKAREDDRNAYASQIQLLMGQMGLSKQELDDWMENLQKREAERRGIKALEIEQLGLMRVKETIQQRKVTNPDEEPIGDIQLNETAETAYVLLSLSQDEDERVKSGSGATPASDEGWSPLLCVAELVDYDEEETEPEHSELDCDSNVHGISKLAVQEGEPGYRWMTCGWPTVCCIIYCLQVAITMVVIMGAKDVGDGCTKHILSAKAWWFLHGSKAVAMGIAVFSMVHTFMGVVNDAMVISLVSPHRTFQKYGVPALRIGLLVLIGYAQVLVFLHIHHAANAFINTFILSFITEIGSLVLKIARHGELGHNFMRITAGLNFELTFAHYYPWWFRPIQTLALGGAFIFGFALVFMAFITADIPCPPNSAVAAKFLLATNAPHHN